MRDRAAVPMTGVQHLLKDTTLMIRSPHTHDLPSGPPPEVLDEVAAAWERAQVPFAGDLVLHVECDARERRVTAELRSLAGATCMRLTAAEALALACGDARLTSAP